MNFHRPCGVPELVRDQGGKTRRRYRWYATPWEILRQTPGIAASLKDDLTVEHLEKTAGGQSDTGAARAMQSAKQQLFAGFEERKSA